MGRLLRDVFSEETVKELLQRVKDAYPQFDGEAFLTEATYRFADKNYAERLEQITDCLHRQLPSNYSEAAEVLISSAGKHIPIDEDCVFKDEHFINLTLCRYVSKYGIDHHEISMSALKELTKSFTSEYDIRYFLIREQEKTIEIMKSWTDDANIHVRRLASEGSRPRLPMGKRIQAFCNNPSPILPILEKLKDDPSLYVRRSVANSLNDISKDHPDMAAEIAERWLSENFENAEWVCTHAMRGLYKEGHKKALAVSGFPEPEGVNVWGLDIVNTTLHLGDTLEFSFVIENTSDTDINLMIDYEIFFIKKNGKHAPKVFKLKRTQLKAGRKLKLSGRHPLREQTTRKFYSGRHLLRISVNGERFQPVPFYLSTT